jgi:hypothetical protein
MKRFVVGLTLLGMMFASTQSLVAGDWQYGNAGYAPVSQQQDHPILRKVLIGAGLVGVGFLAGRLTAPKPNSYYGYGQQPIQLNPQYGGGQPWQSNYQPSHAHHRGPSQYGGSAYQGNSSHHGSHPQQSQHGRLPPRMF